MCTQKTTTLRSVDAPAGAAADRVGAALTDPVNGPKEISVTPENYESPPFLSAVLRALSAESPLRKLCIYRPSSEAVSLLAVALAPGRSAMTALEVRCVNFGTPEGRDLLFPTPV